MLLNFFKVALRNLWRNKAFSAINIFGLSIGIATCLIMIVFVQNELSYDRFNKKADRIVRVIFRGSVQGQKLNESHVMPPTAQALKAEYPEVEEATRLRFYGFPRITYGNKTLMENAFAFVDSNFFQVFTLPLIKGDPKTALIQPNSAVITKAMATMFFGNEDPMGKVLTFKDANSNCKITGVIEKIPENSHFHIDLFVSMASFPDSKSPSWMISEFYTYLVLKEGYPYKQLEAKLPQVVEKYMGPQMMKAMGISFTEFHKQGNDLGLFLQPLTDIHLHSDFVSDLSPSGDIRYVYIFSSIALFMLLIACINFMNLSTASASKRAREIGIRKVLGSVKWGLMRQFLLESILLAIIALLLALVLVNIVLPVFNNLSGKNLTLNLFENPWLLPSLLLFGLFTGVLAGSYPAFFLSSFNATSVLKGNFISGKKSIGLRSGLVVFQFFISIILIVCTAVVYNQLSYIQNKKLGYDKDQVLVVQQSHWLGKNESVYAQQLLKDPRVVNVSISSYLPAGASQNNNFFVYPEDNSSQLIKTLRYNVDYNYLPTLGMQMVAGRNFSKDFATDSGAALLNESAALALGWGKNALGHTLTRRDNDGKKSTYNIIGIVKDFHFKSLHERISPLVMVMGENSGTIIIKTKTKDFAGLITNLKKQWDAFTPEVPFSYSFLDDRFNNTYQSEQKTGRILGIFAGLTIFIACLGVFGLVTFTAERRTKEIGIRKVLGGSVPGIVSLLSKDFLRLVFVAFIIAGPIAWFIMNKWLEGFAYRVNISWWVFALAAFFSIVITMLTISFQAFKAARANPVKSLRSE